MKEREGSLTAMEVFSLEVINQLGRPTIGKFAEFLNISQSNATYKVASLINKGYLRKERSGPDKREYYLVLSEKYYGYIGMMRDYVSTVMERMRERFPAAGAGSGRGDAGHHVPGADARGGSNDKNSALDKCTGRCYFVIEETCD